MPDDQPAPTKELADFPGKLSPMLVKELRQGLRTNMFVIAFILLQMFMVFCLMIGALSPSANDTGAFFWFFVFFTLLVVQPIRGFAALSSEYQLNTMDLLQLTRLDAWRITLGKWTALNAQTLLLVIGILPYLVMRYFLGGVNFVNDMVGLAMLGLASALASAITVGASGYRSLILRIVLLVGCGFGLMIFITFVMAKFRRQWIGSPEDLATIVLIILAAIYGIFFFLSIGASRIAPAAENHSFRKRLWAIIASAACLLFCFFGIEEMAYIFSGSILALASIDAFCEPLPLAKPVARKFSKNTFTRLCGLVLIPGWHTGIRYFFLVSVVWTVAVQWLEGDLGRIRTDPFHAETVMSVALVAMVGLPLILIQLFFPKRRETEMHFAVYMFIQACLAIMTMFISFAMEVTRNFNEYVYLAVPLPSVILIGGASGHDIRGFYSFVAVFTIAFFSIALPWWKSRDQIRELKQAMRNPEALPEDTMTA